MARITTAGGRSSLTAGTLVNGSTSNNITAPNIVLNDSEESIGNVISLALSESATLPVSPINHNADMVSYIGGKNGFTGTETSWGTVAYLALTKATANGDRVGISIWYNTGDGSYQAKGLTLYPVIPIRFAFNDDLFLDRLKLGLSKQPKTLSNYLDFNPSFQRGDYGNVSQIGLSSLVTEKETMPYYEINLTRDDLSLLINQNIRTFKAQESDEVNLLIRPRSIRVDDYNVSILARPKSGDPGTDYLYIGLSYAVSIDGDYKLGKYPWVSNRRIRYSIPQILLYELDKDNIKSRSDVFLSPDSWTYPFRHGNIDSSKAGNHWNKRIISGRKISGAFWPYDLGSLLDITYSSDVSSLLSYCIRGETSDAPLNTNSDSRSNHYAGPISFTSEGYYANTGISLYPFRIDFGTIANHVEIESKGGMVWLTSSLRETKSPTTSPKVMLAGCAPNSYKLKFPVGTKTINNCDRGSISFSDDGDVYLHYISPIQKKRFIVTIPNTPSGYLNFAIGSSTGDTLHLNPFVTNKWNGPYSNNYNTNTLSYKRPYVDRIYFSVSTDNTTLNPNLAVVDNQSYLTVNRAISSQEIIDVTDIRYDDSSYISPKYFTTFITPNNQIISYQSDNVLPSTNTSGLASSEYFQAKVSPNSSTKGNFIHRVWKTGLDSWEWGLPVPEYWVDPVFGSGYWEHQDISWDRDRGVRLQINVTGCYGIRSVANPLTTSDWNTSLPPIDPSRRGGIAIDTTRRPDMLFKYSGNKQKFLETFSTWRGGYWAVPEKRFKVKCTHNGQNLLLRANAGNKYTDEIFPGFWNYDETGYFNCYLPLDLKFPDNYDFTDPNFILNDVKLEAWALNSYNQAIGYKKMTLTIDPPNPTGYIRSDVGYKTDGDIVFSSYRDSTRNSNTYTEIHDIIGHIHAQDGEGVQTTAAGTIAGFGSSSGIYRTFSASNLSRGEGIHFTYVPKLYGVKPNRTGGTSNEITKAVTYCKGHKYSIDNVKLYMGISGTYGNNLLAQFSEFTDPYQYVDVSGDHLDFKAVFDINHENWALSSPRSSYSDINVYPGISGIYIYTLEGLEWAPALHANDYSIEFVPVPGDNTLTYPNVDNYGWSKFWWKDYFVSLGIPLSEGSGIYATGLYLPSTSASLNDQEIILPIYKSGRYRIFLGVEDEFGQFSEWCLTNPTRNYNHPFEAI